MRLQRHDKRNFLEALAPFIEQDGARNLKRISDKLGIPYQTLRVRMLQLDEIGISIYTIVDPEKVGLERVHVEFKVPSEIDPSLKSLLGGLHQSSGLVHYERIFHTQSFNCQFMIPMGRLRDLRKVLRTLQDMNLLSDVTSRKIIWRHILPMKAQYYDYGNAAWDIDFSQIRADPSISIPEPSRQDRCDHIDVMIVKSMQLDPLIKSVEIAKQVGVTPEDISYHIKKHVFGLKQVPRFTMKWNGPKEAWSKHSILGATFVFPNLSDEETRHAMSVLTSLPFTWAQTRTEDGTYFAETIVPINFLSETSRYLSDNFRALGLVPQVGYVDWSCTSSYTVPHTMHASSKGWTLKAEESLGYILEMVKTYG